jgi:subtilisin family serine protease
VIPLEVPGVIGVPTAVYCYLQGTSMASPHVTGVIALVESMGMSPGAAAARVSNTADPRPCPSADVVAQYGFFPSVDDPDVAQTCQGGLAYNSWFGHGEVNALAAVS